MILDFKKSPFSDKAWEFFRGNVYLGTISNRTGVWRLDDGYFENINSSDYRQIADKLDELNGGVNG